MSLRVLPHPALPPVDQRLVAPESRYEIVDGRVQYVSPADERHAARHSKLSALLEAHAAEDYEVASDMLTRTSEKNDFAPDASVYPRERDPETGGRRLEELAFEVASTESLSEAGKKARELALRGVRRVFAIDVERQRAVEWSRETDAWRPLEHDSHIEDRTLAAPLPVRALLSAAKADDAMARALLVKNNPILTTALEDQRAEGRLEALAGALLSVLTARGLQPTDRERARIAAERDEALLASWIERAVTGASVRDVLGDRE